MGWLSGHPPTAQGYPYHVLRVPPGVTESPIMPTGCGGVTFEVPQRCPSGTYIKMTLLLLRDCKCDIVTNITYLLSGTSVLVLFDKLFVA